MTHFPTPTLDGDGAPFWLALRAGRIDVQACAACGTLRHPPRPMCPQCNSLQSEAVESSGHGAVFSFVMPRHPEFPGLDNPEIVAIVELDEGTRLVTNLVDVEPAQVSIGMRVAVRFVEFDGGLVLPQFAPEALA